MKGGKTRRTTYFEQKFRILKDTTFIELRNEAIQFWDLRKEDDEFNYDFRLILPNNHDIMTLNNSVEHQAHTIAKYFEIHRSKK